MCARIKIAQIINDFTVVVHWDLSSYFFGLHVGDYSVSDKRDYLASNEKHREDTEHWMADVTRCVGVISGKLKFFQIALAGSCNFERIFKYHS